MRLDHLLSKEHSHPVFGQVGGFVVSSACLLGELLKEFVELLAESRLVVVHAVSTAPVGCVEGRVRGCEVEWCFGTLLGPEATPVGWCFWSGIFPDSNCLSCVGGCVGQWGGLSGWCLRIV